MLDSGFFYSDTVSMSDGSTRYYHYDVAGLILRSALELPGYWPAEPGVRDADVEIRIGQARVPPGPYGYRADGLAITATECFFHVADVADFLVSNGRQIVVQPHGAVPDRNLRSFTMGTAFGLICHQRGDLPLHASCVRAGEGAACFIGDSGAGKSTIAATLNTYGYDVLSDDIAVIRFDEHQVPFVSPSGTKIKLWHDALEALSIPTEGLERDFMRVDKYHLTVEGDAHRLPVPLKSVFLLSNHDSSSPLITPLHGVTAVASINENIYRYPYGKAMGLEQRLFSSSARIANYASVFQLKRARNHLHEPVIHLLTRYLRGQTT
jgi:hypothetical protein